MKSYDDLMAEIARLNALIIADHQQLETVLLNTTFLSVAAVRERIENLLATLQEALQRRQALVWMLSAPALEAKGEEYA